MEDGSLHRFRRYVRPRKAATARGRIQALRRSPQRLPRRVRSGKPPGRRSRGQYTRPGRRFPCPERAPALSGSPNRHPRGPTARPHRPRAGRNSGPPIELTRGAGPLGRFRSSPIGLRPHGVGPSCGSTGTQDRRHGVWTRFDRKGSTAKACPSRPEHGPNPARPGVVEIVSWSESSVRIMLPR